VHIFYLLNTIIFVRPHLFQEQTYLYKKKKKASLFYEKINYASLAAPQYKTLIRKA